MKRGRPDQKRVYGQSFRYGGKRKTERAAFEERGEGKSSASGSKVPLAMPLSNGCSGSDLRINQTPEPVFATMFLLKCFNELQVRRVVAVIHDRSVAGLAFGQVTRRVSIAPGLAFV